MNLTRFLPRSRPVAALHLGPTGWRTATGAGRWQIDGSDAAALAAALTALPTEAFPPKAALHVEVAAGWAPMRVIRWPQGLRGRVEREAFVRSEFVAAYGAAAERWALRVEPAWLGGSSLAAALEPALIAALRSVVQARRLRLRGLSPALVSRFNLARATMSEPHGALALIDDGRLWLGVWHDREWCGIRNQPVADSPDALGTAVGDMLTQLLAAAGRDDGGTVYLAGTVRGVRPPLPAHWRHAWLDTPDEAMA